MCVFSLIPAASMSVEAHIDSIWFSQNRQASGRVLAKHAGPHQNKSIAYMPAGEAAIFGRW